MLEQVQGHAWTDRQTHSSESELPGSFWNLLKHAFFFSILISIFEMKSLCVALAILELAL